MDTTPMFTPKLVRDKIPQIIEESGKECVYHVADEHERRYKMHAKLLEEGWEFMETPTVEEAADIYEVFRSLLELHNISMDDVKRAAIDKYNDRGGFEKGYILEEVKD